MLFIRHYHFVFATYWLCGGGFIYQQIAHQKRIICVGGRCFENKVIKDYQGK